MPTDDYKYTGVKDANNVLQEQIIQPSNFETVDYAFYDFINEKMDIRAVTNKGWKKVPIVWSSAERAFFSKENKDLRDLDGTLILPLIGVERTSLSKDLNKKGSYFGGTFNFQDPYHGSRITVARRIVSDKTNNFAVADNRKQFGTGGQVNRTPDRQSYFPRRDKFGKIIPNKKAVYETISIPVPVYITMTYNVTFRSEYQQQMNQMIQPFATLGGHINSFNIYRDGHKYEAFLRSDLAQANNIASFDQEERTYQTVLTFEVLGYVIGEGKNGERPRIIKRQNAVEVKIPRERVILGDIQEFDPSSGFYRE